MLFINATRPILITKRKGGATIARDSTVRSFGSVQVGLSCRVGGNSVNFKEPSAVRTAPSVVSLALLPKWSGASQQALLLDKPPPSVRRSRSEERRSGK